MKRYDSFYEILQCINKLSSEKQDVCNEEVSKPGLEYCAFVVSSFTL